MKVSSQSAAWLYALKMERMTVFHVTLLSCSAWCNLVLYDAEIVSLCARVPPQTDFERTGGDGGFKISVDDDPELQLYAPGTVYQISITGSSLEHTISGAYIVAVPYNSSNENNTIGKYHLVDGGHLAFHVACSHIVTTVDNLPKAKVYVMWTSPTLGTGCVEFRATVVRNHVWYKDEGALTKVLCAKQIADNIENIQTEEISPEVDCCACGMAKYQLTFHSLWSRSIHLQDFPDIDTSLPHWSPLVGSSHSKQYVMWRFNMLASRGVSDVCQFGDTRALEDEIRHQSSDVRTVIKTPGIRWTQEHGLQQQRWAHFSVDDKHHLLSVLSRLSPSPDWCVGVSALDLCLDNCTWLADTTVRLYAWDAGVSNSDSYTSEYRRSGPVQPIHHLPDHVHDNPGLPFRSDTSAEPMALLRLQRFDLQPGDDAACSQTRAKEQRVTKVDYPAADTDHLHQNSCVMGSWSEWNKCSATCGTGVRTRTRTAIVMTDMCPELQQTVSEPCKTADCVGQCALHSWSEWSPCSDGFLLCLPGSNDAGSCSRHRSRFFRQPGAEAFCNQTVEEEEPCRPSVTRIVASFDADIMSKCFSPADIGPCKGNFLRWYYDPDSSGCQTFLYGGCRGNANRYATEEDCMRVCRQYAVNASQRNTDDGFQTDIGTMTSSKSSLTGISNTTKDVAFDAKSDSSMAITPTLAVDCLMSPWSKWSDCSVTCGRHGVRMRSRTTRRPPSGGGKKCPRRKFRRRKCSMPACSETSQCQYTEWSSWSACARSCGHDTVQERIQRVQASLSQRSPCPVKLQRRLCSLPRCTVN